jgi:uncharacterized protein YndB with AHSA1/START domain
MSTPSDDSPKTRSVEVELEVPGTPEEVWDAIATGPGISSWFVPAEVDGREGGTVAQRHGSDWDTESVILAWEPPRRFAYGHEESRIVEGAAPAPMADEFIVEARSGDTCLVRVVTSGFGSGEEWDQAIESIRGGWSSVLQNLRLYLQHFRGEHGSTFSVGGIVNAPPDRAWAELTSALGLPEAAEGERAAASAPGVPALAGVVERAGEGELLLRLEEPAPGLATLHAGGPSETVYAFVRVFLFGDDAPAVLTREEPLWRAWMEEHFPAPAEAGAKS